jgi:hypothetical protein
MPIRPPIHHGNASKQTRVRDVFGRPLPAHLEQRDHSTASVLIDRMYLKVISFVDTFTNLETGRLSSWTFGIA